MRIGAALFLIALGAILKWAVHKHISGLNLHVVGVILLVIGIIGLVLELILWASRRNRTMVTRSDGVTYVDTDDPVTRP
ncbi:MAG TPA: DUF6458 family protein [Jatrophihabitans sp.]|nr:DUF6458 family protein [Jatrophihabitans sp.]